MRVLVGGATGFIGRRLVDALHARGHSVIAAARRPEKLRDRYPDLQCVSVDYRKDHAPEAWLPRLRDVDAVVNAVGIFQGSESRFEALHIDAPQALFEACVQAGVRRVIQISALGADPAPSSGPGVDTGAQTPYHQTKHAADEHLRSLPLDWTIVQPSLVYGPEGASARLFTTLAALPLIPLPGRGDQIVQPVHLNDLVALLVALLENGGCVHKTLPAVGPEPVSLRAMLSKLRSGMSLGPGRFLPMPMSLVKLAAGLAEHLPGVLLSRDALQMLQSGNQGDPADTAALLGRPPVPVQDFVDPVRAPAVRLSAELNWLLPLLRLSIALVWLGSGIVSLGLYPVDQSYALLAGVGVTGALAPLMLYGAAGLDIALGVATLALRRRRLLWLFQIGLIVVYSAILTVQFPEFWLHPFGPLLKNLPMLAILAALLVLERR